MVEYTDTMERLTGREALRQFVLNRLRVNQGEIPYFGKGLHLDIFKFDVKDQLASEVNRLFPGMGIIVDTEGERIIAGQLTINLTEIGL